MRVLGIDPGLATTGYGVIDQIGNKFETIAYGTILTPAHTELSERLFTINQQLNQLIIQYQPSESAIEKLFFNVNVKTALIVGQARGVILLTLAQNHIKVSDYTPLEVKTAVCGYGKADKKQVQYMIQKILCLPKCITQDDTADALAIAICHCHHHKLNFICPSRTEGPVLRNWRKV